MTVNVRRPMDSNNNGVRLLGEGHITPAIIAFQESLSTIQGYLFDSNHVEEVDRCIAASPVKPHATHYFHSVVPSFISLPEDLSSSPSLPLGNYNRPVLLTVTSGTETPMPQVASLICTSVLFNMGLAMQLLEQFGRRAAHFESGARYYGWCIDCLKISSLSSQFPAVQQLERVALFALNNLALIRHESGQYDDAQACLTQAWNMVVSSTTHLAPTEDIRLVLLNCIILRKLTKAAAA